MDNTPINRFKRKHIINAETTKYEIPASPNMKKLGYGTGVMVYLLNRSKVKSHISSPWAIKKVSKHKLTDATYSERLAEEADILRKLSHPNIIMFKAFTKSQDDGRFNLAMEACSASLGDLLEERLTNESGPLEVEKINRVGLDVTRALKYLHDDALILHADLKSFNILVNGDFDVCKLCDFGVSLPIKEDGLLDLDKRPNCSYVGTDIWSAPEVFEEDSALISVKSEIFSFGLVIYECIALVPPHTLHMGCANRALDFDDIVAEENTLDEEKKTLDDDDDEELSYMSGTRPLLPDDIRIDNTYNDILKVFHMCTEDNPEQRPYASELIKIFEEISL